ncbi:MAG TPA: serine hydrolase [Thermoanaerobaculia bacterium]
MTPKSHGVRPALARAAGALLMTLAVAALPVQAAPPSNQDLEAYADKLLSAAYPADQPGAAVLVVKDGQTVLRKGYGLANVELGVPVSPDMVFEIGSVTKQFTAAAILLLQERGQLRVEDDITKYLTDYPTHGEKVTIEHLLTHTSGIPSYTGMPEWLPRVREDMSLDTLIGLFKDKPFDFKPGAEWRYNNSGYILLGAIVEKVSGKSYERFVEEELFPKAGMKASRYGHQEEVIPRRATGYSRDASGLRNASYLSMTQPYAAGSLMSTVDDLVAWGRALSGGAVVSQASLQRMTAPAKLPSGLSTQYAYGLGIGQYAGRRIVEHGGGIFGYVSYLGGAPEAGLYVAILSNNDSAETGPEELGMKILAKALGQPMEDLKTLDLDAARMDEYVGVYRFGPETTRTITRDGTKLFSQRSGGSKQEIRATGPDEFIFPSSFTRYRFQRDARGRLATVEMTPRSGPIEKGQRTDEPIPQERQAIQLDPAVFDAYVGQYDLPNLSVAILREGDQLFASPAGQPKLQLFPESETRFFLKEVDVQIEFHRGEDGKVTGLTLTQGGMKMEGKKK